MDNCLNCGATLHGPYCHQCGQKASLPRLTIRSLISKLFASITSVENKFWFTVKELFKQPAKVMQDYVSGKTVTYYHPIRYFLIWVGLAALINISTGLYDMQSTDTYKYILEEGDTAAWERQKSIQNVIKKFTNLIPLFLIPFYGWISYLLFRKRAYNYAEHLTFVTYVIAQNTIIGLPIFALYYFIPSLISYAIIIGNTTGAIYIAYVYYSLFKISKMKAFSYGLLINFLGLISMVIGVMIITIAIATTILLIKSAWG